MIKYCLIFIDKYKNDINLEIYLYRIGSYYQFYEINYDLMIKYYMLSIEQPNNSNKYSLMYRDDGMYGAMYNLGYYYYKNKNYDEMVKYYKMASDYIENSFYKLGLHYGLVDINYELSNKYFEMSLYNGNTIKYFRKNVKQLTMLNINKINDDDSLYDIGEIYYKNKLYGLMIKYYDKCIMIQDKNEEKTDKNGVRLFLGNFYKKYQNYELMKKYYKMSVNKNNIYAMFRLGYYYEQIEKNYKLMKKYYEMSKYKYSYLRLGYYYKNIENNITLYNEYFDKFLLNDYRKRKE
jgi:tetratricopeptide (TPR) repeat protein